MSDKKKIIIDCDPGCDDAIALAGFLGQKDCFDVIAITSIGGNVDPEKTQRNAIGIAQLLGRTDIPVVPGAKNPLSGEFEDASYVHGETGVEGLRLDLSAIEKLETQQPKMQACEILVEQINRHNGALTLIVIGPMTNLAKAHQIDPTIADKVRIVTMGGAYGNPTGNIGPDECSEFNIYSDPEAAQIVYDNFKDITAFPLDVTHETMQDEDFRSWLRGVSDLGNNYANMLHEYAAMYHELGAPKGKSPLHDFHTVVAMQEPEIYGFKRGVVEIVCSGEQAGKTTFIENNDGNVNLALKVRPQAFRRFMKKTLARSLG